MKQLITTLALVAFTLTVRADLGDASKLPAPAKATPTYETDIKPIFQKSCVKCHSGEKPKGKYNMETKEGVLKGGKEAGAIVVGNSAKTALVHYASDLVTDEEMPPKEKRDKFPALTKDQVALVRAWIDQGCK